MKISKCRNCDSDKLETVIDLGMQPWGNDFQPVEYYQPAELYPLECDFCHDCNLLQLNYTVPKEKMFSNHTYVSGSTQTLRDHFANTAQRVIQYVARAPEDLTVLDIGSNDGTQLKCYQNLGALNVLGVESAKNIAEIARSEGVPTDHAYFNAEYADSKSDTFDIISASGVFFHLEELHSALRAVKKLLSRDGVFVVQFIYLRRMVEHLAFDQIYHEHLVYYMFTTLQNLMNRYDLEICDCYESKIHGGSGIAYITHKGERKIANNVAKVFRDEASAGCLNKDYYIKFMEKIATFKRQNREYVEKAISKGKRIHGIGAPVKGNTLLNYFGFNSDQIEKLIEINEMRKGLKAPLSNIPVIMEKDISDKPDIYYCLAWNFKDEILKRHTEDVQNGIEFYFPVDV